MNWQQPQENYYEDIDQHEAPTEPMVLILPSSSPSSVTVPNGEPTVGGYGIPVPTPHERPFPYQDVPQYPSQGAFGSSQTPVYPVLPPVPQHTKKGKRPAGSAAPGYPVRVPTPVANTQARRRSSSLPNLVGVFFVLVQLLLLVRFVLRLLNIAGSIVWVGLIYTISGVFVLPFRLLFQNINILIPNALEIYTLIAILVYGLFSRLIVRLFKALLH